MFPTAVLEDMDALGLFDVISLDGHDLVLCLLALRRSQEIDSSRYGSTDPAFSCNDFKAWQVFDAPPLHANKKAKTFTGTIVDIPGHDVSWLREVQFASILHCKFKWLQFDSAESSAGGDEVVVVDPPVLDNIELSSERGRLDSIWRSGQAVAVKGMLTVSISAAETADDGSDIYLPTCEV